MHDLLVNGNSTFEDKFLNSQKSFHVIWHVYLYPIPLNVSMLKV